jgi:hypothetical protein
MKKINFLVITSLFLISCSGIKDAGKVLRNEKTITTDEFLVKKRNPLVLPPNYNEIPEPGSKIYKKEDDENKIKKILKATNEENINDNKPSSIEDSILKRIRK